MRPLFMSRTAYAPRRGAHDPCDYWQPVWMPLLDQAALRELGTMRHAEQRSRRRVSRSDRTRRGWADAATTTMTSRARRFPLAVICLAVALVGCSGDTQPRAGQTYPAAQASAIATTAGAATSPPPDADGDPATEPADVVLDLADFSQRADDQAFTVTNAANGSVDMDDWSVVTNSRTSDRTRFPRGLVLASGQSVTVHTKTGANSSADVYLGLPVDVAAHVYTPGDPTTGFIDIVSNDGPQYFRYVLQAEPANR